MWPFKKHRLLTKREERALADPAIGKAFRLAFVNDVETPEQVEAFRTVASIMAKRLDREELLTVASFAGIELERPSWPWLENATTRREP